MENKNPDDVIFYYKDICDECHNSKCRCVFKLYENYSEQVEELEHENEDLKDQIERYKNTLFSFFINKSYEYYCNRIIELRKENNDLKKENENLKDQIDNLKKSQ